MATLGAWLRDDVQPRARKYLGAPIGRIDIMSSYSCRGAYGRAFNRLSEHAHANAVDIRGFSTTGAHEVTVLGDWGLTAREIAAQIAAAKAAAERLAAEKAAAERANAALAARQQQQQQQPQHQQQQPPAAIAGAIRALMTRPDSTPVLSTIHCPTLILVGAEDTLTPPSTSDEMHRRILGSELVTVPGAGHLSNLENSSAFNAALARFLTYRV